MQLQICIQCLDVERVKGVDRLGEHPVAPLPDLTLAKRQPLHQHTQYPVAWHGVLEAARLRPSSLHASTRHAETRAELLPPLPLLNRQLSHVQAHLLCVPCCHNALWDQRRTSRVDHRRLARVWWGVGLRALLLVAHSRPCGLRCCCRPHLRFCSKRAQQGGAPQGKTFGRTGTEINGSEEYVYGVVMNC